LTITRMLPLMTGETCTGAMGSGSGSGFEQLAAAATVTLSKTVQA